MHTPPSFHDCKMLESARPSSVQRRSDIYPYLPRIWLGPLQNRYSHFKFEAGPLAAPVLTPIFTGSIRWIRKVKESTVRVYTLL